MNPESRTWAQDNNGDYIDLEEDDIFQRDCMEKNSEKLRFSKLGRKPAVLRPFHVPLVGNANFDGLSASVRIVVEANNKIGLQANGVIDVAEKLAECEAYVAVIDQTRYLYCEMCAGEIKRVQVQCDNCDAYFCSVNNGIQRYTCGTAFHGLNFEPIYIKCAIVMVFKALNLYNVTDANSLANFITAVRNIHTRIRINGRAPTEAMTDVEKFE